MTKERRGLRVLICEDEYLLAMDVAAQMQSVGADVVTICSTLAELHTALENPHLGAHVAFLDVQLMDGEIYAAVPRLEALGIAIIFCSGYPASHGPEHLSHYPWLSKPYGSGDVARALQSALDGRSVGQSG